MTNIFTSANIKSNPPMRQSRVEHDMRKVYALSDFGVWQEIKPGRYMNALKRLGRRTKVLFPYLHVPTTIPDGWHVLDNARIRVHNGRRFVTPARYITVLLVGSPNGRTFAVLGTHFISHAWLKRPVSFRRWRQVRWNYHYRALKIVSEKLYDAGISSIGAGDLNRHNVAKFHPKMEWIYTRGVDAMWMLEAPEGLQIDKIRRGFIRVVFTDHKPLFAELNIKKKYGYKPKNKLPEFNIKTL